MNSWNIPLSESIDFWNIFGFKNYWSRTLVDLKMKLNIPTYHQCWLRTSVDLKIKEKFCKIQQFVYYKLGQYITQFGYNII